ncbi:hypothetical protein OGATHE_004516 [Ogataea polymorpha]|uniref:Uncharacterized protein n=1 Tax=Ogataea polymorpha TaxID=460523 RepID=A0A9P8P078_9ASCO|nr:hypothetical protein OGATHE_004516 [Ogataea polymorpha]
MAADWSKARVGAEGHRSVSEGNYGIWRQGVVDQSAVGVEFENTRAILIGDPEPIRNIVADNSQSLRVQTDPCSGAVSVQSSTKTISNKLSSRQRVAVLVQGGIAVKPCHELASEVFEQDGILVVPDQIGGGRAIFRCEGDPVFVNSRSIVKCAIGVPAPVWKIVRHKAVHAIGDRQ